MNKRPFITNEDCSDRIYVVLMKLSEFGDFIGSIKEEAGIDIKALLSTQNELEERAETLKHEIDGELLSGSRYAPKSILDQVDKVEIETHVFEGSLSSLAENQQNEHGPRL